MGHQLMKLIKNRKAISAVLATILFIIVFVAAISVVLYVIVRQSQLNTMQTKISEVMNERLREKVNVEVLNHYSASFGGVDDYVDCGANASLDIVSAVTINCWIKLNENLSVVSNNYLVAKYGAYIVAIYPANKLYFAVWIGGTEMGFSTDDLGWLAGEWHHVVATYDGANMRIYGDATLLKIMDQTGAISTTTNKLGIAANITQPANTCFNGTIDEVRVYNRTLSAEEVVELYHESYRDNTGLVMYLPLNSNFNDYSGNGNQGTPSGSPTFVSVPEAVFTNIGEHSILIKYIVYVGVNATSTAIPLSPNSSYRVLKEGQTGIITSLGNFFATPS